MVGEVGEPAVGAGLFDGLDVELSAGAEEGGFGEAEGEAFFEEVGGEEGAVGEGFQDETAGEGEFGVRSAEFGVLRREVGVWRAGI